MSQEQDPKGALNAGQLVCSECRKTEVLRQEVRGVIHDFNNILEVIIGYSELVLAHAPQEQRLRIDLAEIRKAADQGASLTRNLLRTYQDQVLEPEALDLNNVLHASQHFLKQLIGDRVEFRVEFGTDLFPVKVNTSQAQQIVMNLLTNARDAMPQGGKVLIKTATVELNEHHSEIQLEVPAGRYTTLSVSDTGNGMDEETRAHMFEPFFSTKEIGKGTGLGLAIVSAILKQTGGYGSVESRLGSGTTFKIFLPAAADTKPRKLSLGTEVQVDPSASDDHRRRADRRWRSRSDLNNPNISKKV